jgi:transporter family protein
METWLLYALGGAIFGAMVTILAKIGLKEVDSNLATAVRTVVVLFFAWGIVFAIGAQGEVFYIDARTWTFLMLSGLATGGSWLCFFRALQLAEVNQVTPLKKSSTILTIILAVIFLGEPMGIFTILGLVLIAAGTWFMIKPNKKPAENQSKGFVWFLFALAAAIFASLTAIFARIGFENIDATLGTAIRTLAVLPISWLMVFLTRKKKSKPTSFRACEEINVQDCEGFLSQCEEGKPPLARGKQGFSDEAMRQKD